MKESIGSTASLNIVFTFLAIIFAFLAGTLSYYKAYKVNNVIVNSIEKYEGFNVLSINEINNKIDSLGYIRVNTNCDDNLNFRNNNYVLEDDKNIDGICVYINSNDATHYDQYLVVSYMTINIPIISDLIKLPVRTVTDNIYRCYGKSCE